MMEVRSEVGMPPACRVAITVRGVVQGVGFRPFVYNAARDRGLAGWVSNEADMVRIEVQGDAAAIDAFLDVLRHSPPPQARVDAVEIEEIGVKEDAVFRIRTSEAISTPRPTIPADLATCRECLAEIRDPSQRRYNYPFTNCTNCGPRWSIIEQLPYDRPRTSMARFTMCAECQAEYDDPADRRFHAQPIACPRCGPTLQLLDTEGHETATGQAALDATAQLLIDGRIVAIKGLGGFQLLVDAANAEAVARLRRRKRRSDRPFAIMLPSLDDVRLHCEVSDEEARLLSSHQAPIVLLRRRVPSPLSPLHSPLSPVAGVAPGNPYLGVMLPHTPLHHLLMSAVARPVVCTSGNLAEEPMAIAVEDALRRLGPIADAFLTHNRPIVRPVDDSIVRLGPDGPQVLRRARGFAPLPIGLQIDADDVPTVLAVGGHLKNAVALALGRVREPHQQSTQVVKSAHVGDLDNVLSVDVFRRAIDDLLGFFQAAPDAVVCDLHPDYASTQHAQQLSAHWDVPLVRVQHHHAHVAACMAEHGLRGPVLGFSWDGTGYGPDGTIWGGEVLRCEGPEFQRVGRLRTFALPGGDRAVREPRRSALGLLVEMLGEHTKEYAADWFNAKELDTLLVMLRRSVRCPRTSSMGRLFDAVAALCGLPPVISFEGQAAMALEYAADENEQIAYPMPIECFTSVALLGTSGANLPTSTKHCLFQAVAHDGENGGLIIDWAPMIRGILADRAAGVPVSRISARFHNALADAAVAVARCVDPAQQLSIVLTGGCFQNALLTARLRDRLSSAGFQVYTHREVPPGDGGIALGQVFLALQQVSRPAKRRSTV
jgi:hydrogenase maturation protein HypF